MFVVEGGCSIPNAVRTEYSGKSLTMHGILLNLDGSRYVKDQMDYADLSIPMTTPQLNFLVSSTEDDLLSNEDDTSSPRKNLKRKRVDSETEIVSPPSKITSSIPVEPSPLYRHYAYVCAVDTDSTILENAEICGTNLAVKLMQMGAASILEEIREKTATIPAQS